MELPGTNVSGMASGFGEMAVVLAECVGRARAKKKRAKQVRPWEVLPSQIPQAPNLHTAPRAAVSENRRALVGARSVAGSACLVEADPLDQSAN